MSDLTTGRIPGTPADLQQPLPVESTDRPITVSRSCVKPTETPNEGNAQGWESSHSGPGRGQVLAGGDGPEGRSLLPDHEGKAGGALAAERHRPRICDDYRHSHMRVGHALGVDYRVPVCRCGADRADHDRSNFDAFHEGLAAQ